jgi:hypothetical protein
VLMSPQNRGAGLGVDADLEGFHHGEQRLGAGCRRTGLSEKLQTEVPADRVKLLNGSHLASWASSFPAILTQPYFGRPLASLLGIVEWASDRVHRGVRFVPDQQRVDEATRLRDAVFSTENTDQWIHVFGEPGVGKSRMVLEAMPTCSQYWFE